MIWGRRKGWKRSRFRLHHRLFHSSCLLLLEIFSLHLYLLLYLAYTEMIYEILFHEQVQRSRSCWCEIILAYCLLHIPFSLLLIILAQTHLTRPSCAVQSASRKKPLLPGTLFWISNKNSLNLEHGIPDARHWSISSTSSRLSNEFHGRQVGDCEQRVTSRCEKNAAAIRES